MMETARRTALCMFLKWILLLNAFLPLAAVSQDGPAQDKAGSAPAPPVKMQASQTQSQRLRIGLALSGGGALGLAEIGVIQWMEENHIPVDRITGTSMGSIIGAMYATGMSPAQIKDFAKKIDWDLAFLPGPTYSDLSYRRKQDGREFLINAPLGLKHGLSGPNGFNAGQGVGLLLDRIAYPESNVASFDDLPIPFRCVATDMLSGEGVVLRKGPLSQAVRASMAIPGVFTPVEINGQVLADGGMVQNIPVETVREMGADVVVAVELRLPPGDRAQLETLTGVLSRAVDVMITQNERRSLALAQATVSVNMSGFGLSDYGRVEELAQLGYKSAASQSAVLLPYAIQDPAQWQQYLVDREARKPPQPSKVETIEVTGADDDTDRRLQHRLSNALGGPLHLDKFDTQLTRIAGEGQFDRLGYEGFTQNGVPGLRVEAHEKSYGPPFVDLAVNVEDSGVAAFDFSAGARVTFMDIAHHGGEWRNDLLFGSSNLAATEFYQPVAGSRFFVAPYAFASKLARNSFNGLTRVAVFGDERTGGGFDVGYDSGRRSELRFGYEIYKGKLSPLIGNAGLPIISGSTGEFRARYVWDGQDSPSVPSRGTRVIATLSRVLQSPGLAHPIGQADLQTSSFIPVGAKTSLFLLVSGGTTFRGNAGLFQVFALGGPFRLGAYLPQQFLGNHYAYASLGFRREFYRLPQLVGRKIYWGGWYEAGSAFGVAGGDPGPVVVRGTFNLGVIADTIVGPIALAGSVSPSGQSRVNFSIGRIF
ncbi:MAG TPA: patatin-like phospholipase family protein [Candidatus Sulfotelmatobacter sp.]|nr:patatin-like phospholipase family protein [Candidatus Sulfotelmatobacter sp.]